MNSATLALAGDFIAIRPQTDPGARAMEVHRLLWTADLAVGNFEIALATGGIALEKTGVRQADPAIGATLAPVGFDVLSVANNHTVDYGWEGLHSTMQALRDSGCAVIGGGGTLDEAAAPVIRDVGGVKIGVIAFSCLTPAGARATQTRPGIAAIRISTSYQINPLIQIEEPGDPSAVLVCTSAVTEDMEYATRLVRQLSRQCTHVVVSLHWGFGSGEDLAGYQQPLAHALVDAGASVIHGHHPHAVHGLGFYRRRPIFYSAGAYMAEQFFQPASPIVMKMRAGMSKDGYVARLRLDDEGVGEIRIHPTVLDDSHQPTLARGKDFERILQRLQRLSEPHGAEVSATASGDAFEASPTSTPTPGGSVG